MSWGIPPKFKIKQQITDKETGAILTSCKTFLEDNDFVIIQRGDYSIQAERKMKLSFYGAITFSGKAWIEVSILVSKDGLFSLDSNYNYRSYNSGTFTDFGKQREILSPMLDYIAQ